MSAMCDTVAHSTPHGKSSGTYQQAAHTLSYTPNPQVFSNPSPMSTAYRRYKLFSEVLLSPPPVKGSPRSPFGVGLRLPHRVFRPLIWELFPQLFRNNILRISPKRIVYISCNPATLARDLKIFAENGYKTEVVCPYDLFPRTEHVECVVRLCRT